MNDTNAMAMIFSRNAFYRRLHFLAFFAFLLNLIVIGILVWVVVFLIKNPTEPLYFATDKVGRLVRDVPVNRPNMSIDEVRAWVIEAVESTYSYDYVNYRSQLQNAQKYFTQYGWTEYMRALTASNNLLALAPRKQIVIAKVVETPRLITEGLLSGKYAYKFEIPVLMTYWEPPYGDKKLYNPIMVDVIVQRQEILQSYQGLAVLQMIATIATTTPVQPQEISSESTR